MPKKWRICCLTLFFLTQRKNFKNFLREGFKKKKKKNNFNKIVQILNENSHSKWLF